jgi:hypothetical protein
MHNEQYEKARNEIALLKKINITKIHKIVEFGALVITNKQNMFVSTSLGKITIDNKDFYAISNQVPIYKAMENLKKGDKFIFNGNDFIIENIL